MLADLLNMSLERNEDLGLGVGMLTTLLKPGKPAGPVENIRPIVLLPLLRKILSLIVLARMRTPINAYLSSSQSAYRAGRSTADIIWAHRWLIAKTLKYRVAIHILGLDMSRAFDTIDRQKLLDILETIPGLSNDCKRLIRILLANTSLIVRFNGILTQSFESNIGSPQGDALSPILFAVYLEYALRELRKDGPQRPRVDLDADIPLEAIYADDVDFISLCHNFLDRVHSQVGPIFKELNLLVNSAKTERTIIGHNDMLNDEYAWCKVKKLGSLLGVKEDVGRRILLATQCFKKLNDVWKYRKVIHKHILLNAYKAIVESVLLYNCGTWALDQSDADKIDAFQRKLLRQLLGYKWYDKITNEDLYAQVGILPASVQVVSARWRLFGHTLRLDANTPARKAMVYYFSNNMGGRQGPRVLLPTSLSKEYKSVTGDEIDSLVQYNKMIELSKNREEWKVLVDSIVETCKSEYVEKMNKKRNKHQAHEPTHRYALRNNKRTTYVV